MSTTNPYSYRAFLRMKNGGFCPTEQILMSGALQEQCAEKRLLKRIAAELWTRSMLVEIQAPANSNVERQRRHWPAKL